MKQCFWRIAKSTTVRRFEDNLKILADKKQKAVEDILKVPPKKWCRAFFNTDSRIDLVDNNMCEAFNGTLLEARKKSIISLFEHIKRDMMVRIVRKRQECSKWRGNIGPNIWKIIGKNSEVASKCVVRFNGDAGYEVDLGEDRFIVNLEDKRCTCRRFDLSGIPCAHAICAIRDLRANVEDYVSSWYHQDIYRLAYGYALQPIPDKKDWPKSMTEDPILPPLVRKMPGRPKVCRRKDPNEPQKHKSSGCNLSRKGMIMTCTLCHKEGHNKRGCPLTGREVIIFIL